MIEPESQFKNPDLTQKKMMQFIYTFSGEGLQEKKYLKCINDSYFSVQNNRD